MRANAKYLLSLLLLWSCGHGGSLAEDTQQLHEADVTLAGGRNRMVVVWRNLPDDATALVLDLGREAGSVLIGVDDPDEGFFSLENQKEGKYQVKVDVQGASLGCTRSESEVVVYGESFEGRLQAGSLVSMNVSGANLDLSLGEVKNYCWCASEIEYTSVSRGVVSRVFGKEESSHILVPDFLDGLRFRPVYCPESLSGDLFYGPWTEVDASENVDLSEKNEVVDGYRGIWFDLGQAASSYGSKYSGGLGTYTMKHIPMAVYSPVVDRTYFVFGGTPSEKQKYLLCMVGCYDHKTGRLQKPRIVMDKGELGVADPHDDPTIQIDKNGYIWVFVAGRGNKREGLRYRSRRPYDISSFELINSSIMAYPQVMYSKEKGFFLFFTRYDGTRQLFWQTSTDGVVWSNYSQLASIKQGTESNSGHYQISNMYGDKLCTAFNRHINGNVDTRTNIYYLQSVDWGKTWTTASGEKVSVPVKTWDSNCLVKDYQHTEETHNCYIKDLNFDSQGNPVILYLTSRNHLTGPDGGTRQWHVLHWTGSEWGESLVTTSTHCYDSGSIWTEGPDWYVIAPTDAGPQFWGTGGEVVRWKSSDSGKTWQRDYTLTSSSVNNHSYMRRPWYAADGFYCFWADGNPDKFTKSNLYFCNKAGQVFRMPYDMKEEWEEPENYKL